MWADILYILGTNILSSIVYDMGKSFIDNGEMPLTEQQVYEIINSFECELNKIFISQNDIENRLGYIQMQNEAILKLLLMVFDQNSLVRILYTPNGYQLEGEYTLNHLNDIANDCLNSYINLLPQSPPKTLSEAVWPIPTELKGVLLDEIEQILDDE